MIYNSIIVQGRAELVPATCSLYPESPGFLLVSDYQFKYKGKTYTIPAGFWFNGASVPPLFWQLICSPFDPRILEHALIHDWLYTAKILPRKDADTILVTGVNGLGKWKLHLIYLAVRAGGGGSWEDSAEDKLYLQLFKRQIQSDGRDLSTYFSS